MNIMMIYNTYFVQNQLFLSNFFFIMNLKIKLDCNLK